MLFREGHERQYVGLGIVHELSQFREPISQTIGCLSPLGDRAVAALLDKRGPDHRSDHLMLVPRNEQIVRKAIRERNSETAIDGETSRKRSTDRSSKAQNGADGRYLSGKTHR